MPAIRRLTWFVEKQQLRWSRRRASLLLEVPTRVLNEELLDVFDKWYLGFNEEAGIRREPHRSSLLWISAFGVTPHPITHNKEPD